MIGGGPVDVASWIAHAGAAAALRVVTLTGVAMLVATGGAQAQPADSSESTAAPSPSPSSSPDASGSPGQEPRTIRMARATWDTGWFQAEVHRQLLMELGYLVEGPRTMSNEEFFTAVASGDVDLWANGWFPLHQPLLTDGATPVGVQVESGALQGYFVDLATAVEHDITELADLADPEVAALFDDDGNGRADLVGCNLAWACGPVVDHHLAVFGLADTVEQVQADYSPLMLDAVDRVAAGEPVLYYTFTPNWTVGELVPGRDVRWLQTPGASLPDQPDLPDDVTRVAGLAGCPDDPCQTGWPPNDIRAVANEGFLDDNPPVRRLLEQVTIPLDDILDQNARMIEGEGSPADIRAAATSWIRDNRSTVDDWVSAADPDAVPVTEEQAAGTERGELLRVSVRTLEPFVLYENRVYTGYSVELAEQLASRMGREVEILAVNSIAKQLDDLDREAADIALAGLSITAERELDNDFSLPVFQSGLTILVPTASQTGFLGRAGTIARSILRPTLLWWILGFGLVLLMAAHLIWWFERRDNPDFPETYRRGIWDSFWWSAVTITTVGYGDKAPTGNAGRSFALLWMIAGYFVFASFTASITSTLAISELRGTIAGPSDLPGHTVATVADTEAERWLIQEGVGPVPHPDIDAAYAALDSGDADAVVFDAPVLQYHAAREGAGRVRTVGPVFDEVRYGVALRNGDNELREQVNLALLDMIESGAYEQLRERWFGAFDD
ncbi:glycine betaine/L-proline ABC transporter substrate-binding protein ProX [Salsipaludibacter albus]|uniref:glycine betaine/L-proline ABC transporter substrate-binding protein ProX n=1 Tax=Salsipaludibacter albus TaxID=2849650 RepID=UPI001EE4C2CD|nr:glycine betaine/L-proline ABC transporter substrate-binding protein ProX [Salsipaludibacter albus]MBY5163756.1 glycine betaine/L-proline ABC transporter substrate-binding protein ProX [Salsipaludibacter albus]